MTSREISTSSTACADCGGRTVGWGRSAAGHRRKRCCDCGRTRVERPCVLRHIHQAGPLLLLLADMLSASPSSIRAFACKYGLHRTTVWRWRLHLLAHTEPRRTRPSVLEAVTTRESRKGSREWVRHEQAPHRWPRPPRARWIDSYAPIQGSEWRVWVLSDAANGEIRLAAGRAAARSLERPNAVQRLARLRGISDALQTFVARFRGPATRYLHLYAAWHALRAQRRILKIHADQHELWTCSIAPVPCPTDPRRVEVPPLREIRFRHHDRRESPYLQ